MSLLGKTEYALRLFPLLCSLTSLVLFWHIAVRVLLGPAVLLAVAVFALRPTFILCGSTVKQYSGDLAAALLLTLLALKLWRSGPARRRCLLIGVVGMMVAQCSQAAVFVILGIGLALVLLVLTERRYTALSSLSITLGLWAVGGVGSYRDGAAEHEPSDSFIHARLLEGRVHAVAIVVAW